MKKLTFLLVLSTYFSFAQNQKLGVVLDAETKKPVEFVDVYNLADNTVTNENGKYFLLSANDSISFYKLGYQSIKTKFDALPDTLYLSPKPYELAEIVLTNEDSLFDQVKKLITNNYPVEWFNEKFFIRSLLKYNGEITRIQDIQGKLRRKTLLYAQGMDIGKKDYVFEVQNMRQIGLKEITENETDIYFTFRSLKDILLETVRVSIVRETVEIEERYFDDKSKVRLDFTYNGEDKRVETNGFYIINLEDKTILQFYQNSKFNLDFIEKKDIKYRLTSFEKNIIFDKEPSANKYVLKNAKLTSVVEVRDKAGTFQTAFESEDILKSYAHFANMRVKKNVNENKDVFKLKFPYNKDFWDAQNQLLLTDEMQAFIEKLGKPDGEYDVRSNLD